MSDINRQQRAAARKPPPRHIIDRLAERAETTGCDRCGARFGELMPYAITATRAGTFSVRCMDCLEGTTTIGIAAGIGGGDPWSNDDRAWFAAHPTRRWRLREPVRGELEAMTALGHHFPDKATAAIQAGLRSAVAVFQPMPGKRMRYSIAVGTNDPLGSFTDAGILAFMPWLAADAAKLDAMTDEEWRRVPRERAEARMAAFKKVVSP